MNRHSLRQRTRGTSQDKRKKKKKKSEDIKKGEEREIRNKYLKKKKKKKDVTGRVSQITSQHTEIQVRIR